MYICGYIYTGIYTDIYIYTGNHGVFEVYSSCYAICKRYYGVLTGTLNKLRACAHTHVQPYPHRHMRALPCACTVVRSHLCVSLTLSLSAHLKICLGTQNVFGYASIHKRMRTHTLRCLPRFRSSCLVVIAVVVKHFVRSSSNCCCSSARSARGIILSRL